ncbi:EamA family transporter [Streptomyces millisiae]|uniref:EamA family transporter n=1 Tax=Streptomyces millisiae TaxID=3075542 RepID=A0ABU2LXF7_9ACTN|nr:EamA family transporter [Streptomyces sp. DSM 44918]MDT0322283.1 EamA family transporter [Streptomyces sp. DSM 44918]
MSTILLVLGQITSLQLGAAVAKGAYDQVSPLALAGLRLTIAALVLCAVARPRVRALDARQWRAVVGLGLILATMNVAYFGALERLPIGVAATLELLGPLALAVGLSRRPGQLSAALLALAGVLLLAAPGASLAAAGVVLGVLAGACRAGYVLLNRQVGAVFSDWTGLALALAVGACALAPVAAVVDGGAVVAHPDALGAGLAVAVLSSLVPYTLDMVVLRRVDARTFGVLLSLTPAVGAAVGFTLLDERLSARQLGAIALVVAASAWAVAQSRRRSTEPVRIHTPRAEASDAAAEEDVCPVCGRPAPGSGEQWTLRSRHHSSQGSVEYCATAGGCLVVLVDGEIVKHTA